MKRKIDHPTILSAYINVALQAAKQQALVGDPTAAALTPRNVLASAYALSRAFKKRLGKKENRVGLLLPTSLGTLHSFLALHILGATPTMLNFVAGLANVLGACQTTLLHTVVTSRGFVEKASLSVLVQGLAEAGVRILYLEDIRQNLSLYAKTASLGVRRLPQSLHLLAARRAQNEEAVILFTSGSEGTPKGVALSHANLIANVNQFLEHTDVGAQDRMFNCLPMYHSFGLTVGTLLPLLSGMGLYLYPSPLHYHEIPRLVQENGSTILLSTDTFLTGYARYGSAQQFASLRYIVPGAEKLKDATLRHWKETFGKTLFEGYGVTETAPVISVNTAKAYKADSSGQILEGMEHKLKPVAGIEQGGELWIRGPNVMMGYIKGDKPGVIQPLADGWHNTGDIAEVDEKGFLSIRGRLKRFAKIGGEMVSLVTVEQAVARVWPGFLHAVVAVPHARKGEALVLLTEKEDVSLGALIAAFKANGETQIPLPRQIFTVPAIPILGPGKLDFITAKSMAQDLVEREAAGLLTDEPDAPARQTEAG